MVEHRQAGQHESHDSRGDASQHEGHEKHKDHHEMKQGGHSANADHGSHHGGDHHAHMVADFRRRFWISLGGYHTYPGPCHP